MQANLFAYAMLLLWPLVSLYLIYKCPLNRGIIWTILGGYLLLPAGLVIKNSQIIPGIDKNSVVTIAALVGCVAVTRKFPRIFYRFGIVEILIVVLLVGPFITSELNGDEIRIGALRLPGVGAYDAASAVISEFLIFFPFILGRQYFRTESDNADLLRALVIGGALYSLPMLFEVRMSPQLSRWIYGYMSTGFSTVMRDGGFRPVVFMSNGLVAAFFIATAVLASAALWRAKIFVTRFSPSLLTMYLAGVLILCKSLAALAYGAILLPILRWAPPRTQIVFAVGLTVAALCYPTLRAFDLVPTTTMVSAAALVNADRADFLQISVR